MVTLIARSGWPMGSWVRCTTAGFSDDLFFGGCTSSSRETGFAPTRRFGWVPSSEALLYGGPQCRRPLACGLAQGLPYSRR